MHLYACFSSFFVRVCVRMCALACKASSVQLRVLSAPPEIVHWEHCWHQCSAANFLFVFFLGFSDCLPSHRKGATKACV